MKIVIICIIILTAAIASAETTIKEPKSAPQVLSPAQRRALMKTEIEALSPAERRASINIEMQRRHAEYNELKKPQEGETYEDANKRQQKASEMLQKYKKLLSELAKVSN